MRGDMSGVMGTLSWCEAKRRTCERSGAGVVVVVVEGSVVVVVGHSSKGMHRPSRSIGAQLGHMQPTTHIITQNAGWPSSHEGGHAEPQSCHTLPPEHSVF